ncbi:RNA cap guanine-N2 methyltransferase-domain-containing protein [Amylocarpus encephaloides]|uniref:Trimethylguanosine synthase n=1 Tax=Amylocarpus encephaloides TaxID=45428 RepID=A0A9P7YGL6_9HELO|nr:RNA cap guanine-N2 methyltransferase-domain-containing protein [Amylocarpus encephaloides]
MPKRSGKRKRAQKEADEEEAAGNAYTGSAAGPDAFRLTDECHHYQKRREVPWDIQKYWEQRYSIWSAYDDGIQMTDDAWFGVTPERVANQVAIDICEVFPDISTEKTTIIDMFGGAGGNSIAFALSKRWEHVISIEKDASVIACAQNNAAVYEVSEYITFIHADSFTYLSENASSIDKSKTVMFGSPPWGGPGYSTDKVFNLRTMKPYSLQDIHKVCSGMDFALFLPRTSDLNQIAKLAPQDKKIDVVQYCMEGASKAMVAYIPT